MSKIERKKRDYQKGFIYKLKCLDREIKDIYVGSSTNKVQRKRDHKDNCYDQNRKSYNYYVYQFIRAHGGWDNWEMVVIKLFPCKSKMELEIEEENMRVELEEFSTLNMRRAYLNEEARKEYCRKKSEKYREKHPEKTVERSKKYYENNKEEILEKSKKYYENNKEKIAERQKKYYEIHKEKWKEYRKK